MTAEPTTRTPAQTTAARTPAQTTAARANLERARAAVTAGTPRRAFGTNPVRDAAQLASLETARTARWPDGPGPVMHGTNDYMTRRCKTENGRSCASCRAASAARTRLRRARRAARAAL